MGNATSSRNSAGVLAVTAALEFLNAGEAGPARMPATRLAAAKDKGEARR